MSLVAIVGRPNVGKSTLFNRLVGERKAIVDATAGTTRDRHYGKTDWNGKEFSIIDTGGYTVNSEDIFEDEIRRQVLLAIDEADVILFLVEVRTGITDLDMLMADILRRTSKKVILVCNKVDNNDQIYSSHEFYALGLGDPYCISSMSGSGTGDLMDAILDALPVETASEEDEDLPHITIVGRPNVGKSSLINAILGEELASTEVTPETAALTKFRGSHVTDQIMITFYSATDWDKLWHSVQDAGSSKFLEEFEALHAAQEKDNWVGHEPVVIESGSREELKEEIRKWTSSRSATHYFVKEVEVALKDLPLPEGVVLVDTPGLNDAVEYRSNITKDYIDRANAVFVCVKADRLSGQELATIYGVFSNALQSGEDLHYRDAAGFA